MTAPFKVGDRLYVHPFRGFLRIFPPGDVVVTKVGRKWVQYERVDHRGHASRFDVETRRVDGAGFSSPGLVWPSREAHASHVSAYLAKLALVRALQHSMADRRPDSVVEQARSMTREDVIEAAAALNIDLAPHLAAIQAERDPEPTPW